MRKLIALTLSFLIILSGTVAMAEGKLTVTSKNAILYIGKDSGIFVARVENTGDAPVFYDNGILVIFSEDDEILDTENYVLSSPNDLQLYPGEYTYVYEFLWNSALKNAKVGDVKFSVSTDTRGYKYDQIPATSEIAINGSSSFDNYVHVTFTNTSSDVLYGAYVVCAMMDSNDNIIFVDRNDYDNIGIHPGSTVTLKMYIDNSLVEYYEANGIRPTKVDALVYVKP